MHTANKIDAKLGAKLFKHLFALPFVYFESRKVGNIIARIRELDQIRDFITNKSVSVIIDLLFSTVFLVVMFIYSIVLTFVVLGIVGLIAILYIVVTPELRKSIVDKGHTMRVYVPFGKEWFGYSTRRLKENPKMASHIIKALFFRG